MSEECEVVQRLRRQRELAEEARLKDGRDGAGEPRPYRIFISLRHLEDYQAVQRAKYIQEEHKGKKLGQIDGLKFPAKVALSKGFINTKNGKSDLLEQLKFKRKQLLVQKMSQELIRKQEAAQQKDQQKNYKDDGHGQIADRPMSKRDSPRG